MSSAFAEDMAISGTHQQLTPLLHEHKGSPNGGKDIQFLEYELPPEVQEHVYQQMTRRLEQQNWPLHDVDTDFPKKVQLGMSNVPVLDQGIHGSCVVFAVTAALDAALNRGDYISQLCLLQLGNYLENQDQGTSGWDGSNLSAIVERIDKHGIISIAKQHRYGCAGARLYPSYFFTPTQGMSPEEYAQYHTQPIGQVLNWHFLLKYRRYGKGVPDPGLVQKMKIALNSGSRLVIATLLPGAGVFSLGTYGTHHYNRDTWVLTHAIAQDLLYSKKISGHAMVIIGYDDDAVAKDNAGHIHRGLFKLRSSWSALVGDWGDFYMSYDYAAVLVRQILQIDRTMDSSSP